MLSLFLKKFLRLTLRIFYIFPVKKNRIYFSSFDGKQKSCNPLYIFRELKKRNPELEFVWCLNKKEAGTVPFHSLKWLITLMTSEVLVTNTGFPSFVPFRKKQLLINTWHGGGAYKRVGTQDNSIGKKLATVLNERLAQKNLTWFISSSSAFTEIIKESKLIPQEKFLSIGMPRNDIFFSKNRNLYQEERTRTRKFFNTADNELFILYAPTFRGPSSNAVFDLTLNTGLLKEAAEKRFRKNARLIFRAHHTFISRETSFDADASSFDDMQALLCAADILVTDYSSSIWDYSFTEKPCFLFTPDIELYRQNRGFCTPLESWGFPYGQTNEQLKDAILGFDEESYKAAMKKHHEALGSFEDGSACEKTVSLIQDFLTIKKGTSSNNKKAVQSDIFSGEES